VLASSSVLQVRTVRVRCPILARKPAAVTVTFDESKCVRHGRLRGLDVAGRIRITSRTWSNSHARRGVCVVWTAAAVISGEVSKRYQKGRRGPFVGAGGQSRWGGGRPGRGSARKWQLVGLRPVL